MYEDSGVSVEYQKGVFARTPIKATQTDAAPMQMPSPNSDTLRVEIGPVEGSYPGMLKTRGYELRLPADWPPVSVTVNGKALKPVKPGEAGGWTFEGNTLTTIIPVPAESTARKGCGGGAPGDRIDGTPRRTRRICRQNDPPARRI